MDEGKTPLKLRGNVVLGTNNEGRERLSIV